MKSAPAVRGPDQRAGRAKEALCTDHEQERCFAPIKVNDARNVVTSCWSVAVQELGTAVGLDAWYVSIGSPIPPGTETVTEVSGFCIKHPKALIRRDVCWESVELIVAKAIVGRVTSSLTKRI